MATRAPIVQPTLPAQSTQLCDYCHQKPKFSNHLYCSKTCASQAATLCNHCHKKPKFTNFEYCGKNCASLANPGGKTGPAQGQAAAGKAPTYPKGSGFNASKQTPPAFDPVQIAKLVVQQIPQVQALLASSTPGIATGLSASQTGLVAAVQPVPNPHSNNPFLNVTNQSTTQAPPQGVANGVTLAASSNALPTAQLHISTQPVADDIECLIPGCGKPVHVDAKGVKTSEYCSMRHREEAVTSGLVSPCIMCLVMPQSETDYFCGRACREESMNKYPDSTTGSDDSE
ncbi:hypothetical protein K443DRAFT_680995 [Laccaria amethystina LaAM-08-1]|jgi:hypothetical protein|uniref:Uncharacterized protein n=1 Tax=Laccaria amethystina LaAM-08-1 TaxID=1095629 RepID=A0A0C9X9M5_9AGAR|nr:hypothetical protein K443DRAFT_680995 [Laccaria amethystina LaAM-08-1]